MFSMVDTDVVLDKILKYRTNLGSARAFQPWKSRGLKVARLIGLNLEIGTSCGSTPRTIWGIWSLLEDLGTYGVRATPYSAHVAI